MLYFPSLNSHLSTHKLLFLISFVWVNYSRVSKPSDFINYVFEVLKFKLRMSLIFLIISQCTNISICGLCCQIWDLYLKMAGHSEKIDEKAFVAIMKDVIKDKSNEITLQGPLPLFFNAVDANEDGFIQLDEFEMFFDLLGLDAKTADASFKAIDTNNDGLLSKEEFLEAGVQFFTTDDKNNPTNLFWGPLE